jgi:hypothetical protein
MGSTSLFENQMIEAEKFLESFGSERLGSDLKASAAALLKLKNMAKFQLETTLCSVVLLSLDDADYERLQRKIDSLIDKNRQDFINQGLELPN